MALRPTFKGRREIALNIGARYRGVVSITPPPLYTLEINPGPSGQEAGLVSETVWTFWRRKKYLAPARSVQPDYAIPARRNFRRI
jgi:hypothetical protein